MLDSYDQDMGDLIHGRLDETSETNNIVWSDSTYRVDGESLCTAWIEKKCRMSFICMKIIIATSN